MPRVYTIKFIAKERNMFELELEPRIDHSNPYKNNFITYRFFELRFLELLFSINIREDAGKVKLKTKHIIK